MRISPVGRSLVEHFGGGASGVAASEGNTGTQDDAQAAAGRDLIRLLGDLQYAGTTLWYSCTTAQRPIDPYLGQIIFDTTTGGPYYCSAERVRATNTPAVWTPFFNGGGGGPAPPPGGGSTGFVWALTLGGN